MEYIAITLLAIAATTWVIYLLANKVFGVCLRLRSLVLCAACALFISLVLPRIVVSFAGLAGTVGFLAVFAIIFAYFVAYYDEPEFHTAANACPAMTLGGETAERETAETRKSAAVSAEPTPSGVPEPPMASGESAVSPAAPDASFAVSTDDVAAEPAAADPLLGFAQAAFTEEIYAGERPEDAKEPALPEAEAVSAGRIQLAAAAENEPDSAGGAALPAEADEDDLTPGVDCDADAASELASVLLTLKSPENCQPAEEELLSMDNLLEKCRPEPREAAETNSTCEDDGGSVDELIDPRSLFKNAEFIEVNGGEAAEQVPLSDSLDALLDYAFAQKERCNYQRALEAFRRALKLYRESEAAPYLAIEIATLLKDRGSYDEAINVLSDSRGLPGLSQQHPLDQEFIETIAYLRIVKNTLLHHRLGFIPFHRIPAAIAKEIDAEFRDWRNLA